MDGTRLPLATTMSHMTKQARRRLPTLHDVARRAGVSASTASRGLAGHKNVSAASREGVIRAAEALGYRPNATARRLRTARSMTVGMVVNRFNGAVVPDLLDGVSEVLGDADYSLLIGNVRENAVRQASLMRRLFDQRIDALFLVQPRGGRAEVQRYVEAGVPVLAIQGRGSLPDSIPP